MISTTENQIQTSSETVLCPFIKMTNLMTGDEAKHEPAKTSLSQKTLYGVGCKANQCHAAMMEKNNLPSCDGKRSKAQIIQEAKEFLTEFYQDKDNAKIVTETMEERLSQIKQEIEEKGCYFQTFQELEYGVKLAWRNSPRCIMRIQWKNIHVQDARGPNMEYAKKITNDEMYHSCVNHLKNAVSTCKETGARTIRSCITVFPQILPNEVIGRRIWNSQLVRFAGYQIHNEENRGIDSLENVRDEDILGDPANVSLTKVCLELGWKPKSPRSAFDVLPLIVQATENAEPLLKEIPDDALLMIPIFHPDYPRLDQLNIKWHAIPAISNFCLDIGGCQYPCAPFNGWYMDAEIACRNLADPQRYNLLPTMAACMGLIFEVGDISNKHTLGSHLHNLSADKKILAPKKSSSCLARDKALVELCVAVLKSFNNSKVTIVDHFSASESFIRHYKNEIETRGFIAGDWVWLTPPIGGATNRVFHQEMINFFIKPNFLMPKHTPEDLLNVYNAKRKMRGLASENKLHSPCVTSSEIRKKGHDIYSNTQLKEAQLEKIDVHIFFGSETGVSQNFASRLHSDLRRNSGVLFVNDIKPLNDCDFGFFLDRDRKVLSESLRKTVMIIVTSTFGSGGSPANANRFLSSLYTLPNLESMYDSVDFAIFGVGDSSYGATFNKFAKTIESNLGKKFKKSPFLVGCGDEKKDQQMAFVSFQRGVSLFLAKKFFESDVSKPFEVTSKRKTSFNYMITMSKQPQRQKWLPQCMTQKKLLSDSKSLRPIVYGKLTKKLEISCTKSRQVLHMEFKRPTDKSFRHINPGDHVAILPLNRIDNIQRVMKLLSLSEDQMNCLIYVEAGKSSATITKGDDDGVYTIPQFLKGTKTLSTILLEDISLNAPPSLQLLEEAFSFYEELLSNVSKRNMVTRIQQESLGSIKRLISNSDLYTDWITSHAMTQIEFLQELNCILSFDEIPASFMDKFLALYLLCAPRITPRLYSISTSPILDKNIVGITVRYTEIFKKKSSYDDVDIEKSGIETRRPGLCSDYLWSLSFDSNSCHAKAPLVRMYFSASNGNFQLDLSRPAIMICNGTGIAPFRSFWRTFVSCSWQRKVRQDQGHLYYGCRNRDDHLFHDEMRSYFDKRNLHVVYSRADGGKSDSPSPSSSSTIRYVQDLLRKDAMKLCTLVFSKKAKIYVCGSPTMAEQCREVLSTCVFSETIFQELQATGSYVEEVF